MIKLNKILRLAGWATIISYIIATLANSALRLKRSREFGVTEEILTETLYIYLIGGLLESPFHIPTGLLCLVAANYLKKKPKTLKDIFE